MVRIEKLNLFLLFYSNLKLFKTEIANIEMWSLFQTFAPLLDVIITIIFGRFDKVYMRYERNKHLNNQWTAIRPRSKYLLSWPWFERERGVTWTRSMVWMLLLKCLEEYLSMPWPDRDRGVIGTMVWISP